jgi:hypothetical protein
MRRANITPDIIHNKIIARSAQIERHARPHGPKTNKTRSHLFFLPAAECGFNLYPFLVAEDNLGWRRKPT